MSLNSLNNLGLCRKAGRLTIGFDAVLDTVKAKKVYGVILACDVSAKTEKEIAYYCGKFGVCIKKVEFTMDDASRILNKRVGVYGVDENFYNII